MIILEALKFEFLHFFTFSSGNFPKNRTSKPPKWLKRLSLTFQNPAKIDITQNQSLTEVICVKFFGLTKFQIVLGSKYHDYGK